MKMQDPLFKIAKNLQTVTSKHSAKSGGTSECKMQCDCTRLMAVKLAMSTAVAREWGSTWVAGKYHPET